MRWVREPVRDGGDPNNTYGFCNVSGDASTVFFVLLALVDLLALDFAATQAYHARNFSNELAESKWIGVACTS